MNDMNHGTNDDMNNDINHDTTDDVNNDINHDTSTGTNDDIDHVKSQEITAVLSCKGINKNFHDGKINVEVIKNINFSVASGERVAILGASGSGKTTFLHLLGGLINPTKGNVYMDGIDLNSLSEKAKSVIRNKSIGFVFQFHHLLPEFTAIENVVMPLLLGKTSIEESKERANNLLQRVGLSHRLQHKLAELSGGERQRVAIARALVTKPKCVLADEPTGNLDKHNADEVYQLMLELNQQMNTSFVVVTHEPKLAEGMHRVLQMVDGQLSVG